MIDYRYADLFQKDNVKKDLVLDFGDFQITNNRLYSEAFELSESLCSQSELRFGFCEASVLKFKCRNEFGELKDKWFDAHIIVNQIEDMPFKIGSYRVFNSKPSGDKLYTNITAYDAMYGVLNAEMVEWYDNLSFPISMLDFRNSFFDYLGFPQVEIELINDDILIEKTIDADSISGKQIITAICELNGVFGHINRQGLFDYVSLLKRKQMIHPGMENLYPGTNVYPSMMIDNFEEGLYPSYELFPSTELFPMDSSIRNYPHENVSRNKYRSFEYADFETQLISKVQIRQEENDIGAVYGNGTNTYIVQDNFLVYGKSSNELSKICERLFNKINGVYYRPSKVSLRGNPCVEVGDIVVVHAKYKEVETYVLERSIKGIQALQDTFESKGVYEYAEKVNSVRKEIKRLKGKSAVLERTVEMLNSEINDEKKGLKSQIKQTEEEVTTKVSKGEVVSEINQSAEKVKIKGNKISLEGTVTANENFKILEDGSIQAKNGNFEGSIKSNSAEITGGEIEIETESWKSVISLRYVGNGVFVYPDQIHMTSNEGYSEYSATFMQISDNYNTFFGVSGAQVYVGTNFKVVGGTKERVAITKSYNARSLYCYEMPSPIFGDVGHGVIGEDGLCYVDIDQIFFETVDMNQSYQVFLQSYAESNVYVIEKQPQYFVVKGLPNTEFDWELKAKQLDFPIHRLEENLAEDDYEETDYVALASAYLNEYEQEVLSYE